MFKFDNAFLTKNKHVGIQFIDHSISDRHGAKRVATIYPDHKGQLKADCSVVPLRTGEYVSLVEQYNKREKYYRS